MSVRREVRRSDEEMSWGCMEKLAQAIHEKGRSDEEISDCGLWLLD